MILCKVPFTLITRGVFYVRSTPTQVASYGEAPRFVRRVKRSGPGKPIRCDALRSCRQGVGFLFSILVFFASSSSDRESQVPHAQEKQNALNEAAWHRRRPVLNLLR